MQLPDRDEVGGVEVNLNESATSINLERLGLSLNRATRDAWESISAPLLAEQDRYSMARSIALEPGGDLRVLGKVLGAGVGVSLENEPSGPPGSACIVLYVAEPMTTEMAINYAAAAFNAEALTAEEARVRVVHTGPIDLLSHRFRTRPAPGGVSIGHKNTSAGTLGCLCVGRNAPRDQRMLVLSNNHVLANVNRGRAGDAIYQPGPYDGGRSQQNRLGILERFVNIHFDRQNQVDCATAWVNPADVRKELLYLQRERPAYFRISLPTVPARIGMTVGKSGRTTQLTAGRVNAIGVNIRVNMPSGRVAQFANQIEIRGLTGDFSHPGDSGSLVWTWDKKRQPVGLLFAGGGGSTFANPINTVLNALDINLAV